MHEFSGMQRYSWFQPCSNGSSKAIDGFKIRCSIPRCKVEVARDSFAAVEAFRSKNRDQNRKQKKEETEEI
ncbi:hypothetical protein Goari_010592, partial [Gossypium aridum]|nr:hypothetical protein [Gossypium aridum]